VSVDPREYCSRYAAGVGEVWERVDVPSMVRIMEAIRDVYRSGGRVIAMGNGGMALTAAHVVADLVKHPFVSPAKDRVTFNGPRLQAICLTDNVGTLSSWANDVSFADVFSEQLETWAQPGDVVIAFTTSGNSENLVRAFAVARRRRATTVALTGRTGGRLRSLADICFAIPSDDGSFIEDVQMGMSHIWCNWLKGEIQQLPS
jgi:D-sedoheptulose 7-phosphate isomerase